MAICANDNGKLVGRNISLELAAGCPDTVPAEAEWLYLGPMTSKGGDFSPNTVASESDDQGGFQESLVTQSDLTITAEGEVRTNDKSNEFGIHNLISYYTTEIKARRQPTLWARMVMGSTQIVMYAVITALSWDAGTNDIVTFSIELHPADSDTVDITEV